MSPHISDLYVEILTPKGMVFGGGALGRCLRHESGVLINDISALIKGTPEDSRPFQHVRTLKGPHQTQNLPTP